MTNIFEKREGREKERHINIERKKEKDGRATLEKKRRMEDKKR
jgi:hypothetical protein